MAFREQVCEACGRDFGCGAEAGGCWCDDVTVDPATLAELRARYDRCLCPHCLQALAVGREGAKPRRAFPQDGHGRDTGGLRVPRG